MSNTEKPLSKTSYDIWIAWTYAIVALLAMVAIYGLSTRGDAEAPERIASMQSPQP